MNATDSAHGDGNRKKRPLILIVEDDENLQECYEACFLEEYRLLQAYDLSHARELFHAHAGEIAAVVMDFRLKNDEDTADLTREIRRLAGETLPIIGCSGSLRTRTTQRSYGCNYVCEKYEIPRQLETFLSAH